jgi:hypothetical protein
MTYSQSPPLAGEKWPTDKDISSGRRARDLDLHAPSDQRIGLQPKRPLIRSAHSSSLKSNWAAGDRPFISRRIFRTLTRFFIAVLIGVGATLAWQSYGDAARKMLVTRNPTLAWLLPVSATEPTVVAVSPPASAQQLESLVSNVDGVRHSVEQLAARQEQLAQSIATLQAIEEDIRQKMSSTPPSSSQQAAPVQQQKPPQPRAQSSSPYRSSPPTGPLSLSP